MADSVLDIFNRSGDANVGQTLLRLAALAQAAEQFKALERIADEPADAAAPATLTKPRVAEGIGSRPAGPLPRMEAGPAQSRGITRGDR